MAFIAGAFHCKYGTKASEISVGQIQDGITIEHFVNKQLITGDNWASTPQDAVYQGMEVFVEFVLMEYDQAGALDVFWPYHGTFGTSGTIGSLDTGLARSLLLDHTQIGSGPTLGFGTTAAAQPTTLQADFAVLAEGFPVRMLFAPAHRTIPIRLRLYPSEAGLFFTLT
jgi:hypothetical protein